MKLSLILVVLGLGLACNQIKSTANTNNKTDKALLTGDERVKEPVVLTEDLGKLPKGVVNDYKSSLEKQPAPSFSFTDLEGNIYNNETTKGKTTILKFWFIACKPCIEEIPQLNELTEKYKDKDILFLAPSLDDKADLKKFLDKHEFAYKVGANQNKLMSIFRVFAFPTHIVIDKEGMISTVLMAEPDMEIKKELTTAIDQLIAKE